MTKAKNTRIYFLESGLTYAVSDSMFAPGAVSQRGETIEITPELRRLNTNADCVCVFDLTEEQQLERWGSVKFATGEAPDGVNAWDGDEFLRDKLRAEAGVVAAAIADPVERARALADVRDKFGIRSSQSSVTYSY